MINNHLIMDCMEMQQLKARYDEAKEKENSAGMEAARASYRKLSEKLKAVEKATRRYIGFMRMPQSVGTNTLTCMT